MNEPMHLVPRHIILNIMAILQENNLVADNDYIKEQYDKLEKITDKPPSALPPVCDPKAPDCVVPEGMEVCDLWSYNPCAHPTWIPKQPK